MKIVSVVQYINVLGYCSICDWVSDRPLEQLIHHLEQEHAMMVNILSFVYFTPIKSVQCTLLYIILINMFHKTLSKIFQDRSAIYIHNIFLYYIYIYICLVLSVFMYVCMYVCMFVCKGLCVCVSMYVYMYDVCMYVCMLPFSVDILKLLDILNIHCILNKPMILLNIFIYT